jgi:probable F420-dependent oxidoreductase
VKLGAVSFMTDYSTDPVEFARELEAHGYESLWAGDHSHIPVSERAARDGSVSGEPLRQYKHLLDPIVALSAAATATTHLRLGTGMLLLAQRDPIQTAKSVASLDHLSGGRFLCGVASGWNVKELRNHGTDPARRWDVLEERLAAMQAIWTRDVAEHDGEHVRFTSLVAWPKPIQKPSVPVIIGCEPRHFDRVVRRADGWGPLVDGPPGPELRRRIAELGRLAAEAGRTAIPVTVFRVVPRISELELGSELVVGERELRLYEEVGVERLVVVLPPEREKMLPLLEHYATVMRRA